MNTTKRVTAVVMLFLAVMAMAQAAVIKGKVVDRQTQEPLIGATVQLDDMGTTTDMDGVFVLSGLRRAKYTIVIRYVSYKTLTLNDVAAVDNPQSEPLLIAMEYDDQELAEVRVTGMARKNTEAAVIAFAKESELVISNISAQEIRKTQDNNASEVIRRVPGVSLIDDKFVMVRGLSQRYNNVWINGGAVPSSEADSRAFSFDIIPSSQIDNLVIVKSPSPEYPADFSGGFIQVNTKDIPSENSFALTVGGNWNDKTHFRSSCYAKGSGTDFLGFDNGFRMPDGGFNSKLQPVAGEMTADLSGNGFNNDWRVKQMKPFGDLKLGAEWSRRWNVRDSKLGMVGALNYTNEYRTCSEMENNSFGMYDVTNDRRNYLRQSIDNQYNNNVRVGALLNLTLLSKTGNHKYELKNILNQLATDRYTSRQGISAQSNREQSAEYYYRSRTTYNVQLTGKHLLKNDQLEWSGSYAYANRRMPDRRRYLVDDALTSGNLALTTGNDISREFTKLDEHIMSANVNERHTFNFGNFSPVLKVGAYGEYRSRKYVTRQFIYNWNPSSNTLPEGFRLMDMTELLSNSLYFGEQGLYLLEEMHLRNNYKGRNSLGAGYLAVSLPLSSLSVYAGVRYEYNQMELIMNTRDYEQSEKSRFYRDRDFFPSLNTTYRFNDKHQLRLSYGKSVNRPEFREVSTSVYYDFDLASSVKGNADLKTCYVQNVDVRYEFYPSKGEQITLAAFYKHFSNPIEWTYTVAGGTDMVYSFENAESADNIGVELDIRKDLSFIGLRGFSWSFNGALIHSRVNFEEGSRFDNRPMQGQSPYLVNTGLFYRDDKRQLNGAVLYNRIGKRIIGVGRSEGSSGSEDNARIPDSYEMPRNTLDLTFAKRFGEKWELKVAFKDILSEKVEYKQFASVRLPDGTGKEVEQVTRSYRPGRNLTLSLSCSF